MLKIENNIYLFATTYKSTCVNVYTYSVAWKRDENNKKNSVENVKNKALFNK